MKETVKGFESHPDYTNCVVIYLDSSFLSLCNIYNYRRFKQSEKNKVLAVLRETAFCIFNQDKTDVDYSGNKASVEREECRADPDLCMDGYLDKLYDMYMFFKEKKGQDEEKFRLLRLAFTCHLKTAVEYCRLKNSQMRYIFIVPTHWDIEMRELILRPLFIQAGLIEREDHADRLQFFTKLECQVRLLQLPLMGKLGSNFTTAMKSNRHCLIQEISFAACNKEKNVTEEHGITSFEAVDLKLSVGSLLGVKNWTVQRQAISYKNDAANRNLKKLFLQKKVFEDGYNVKYHVQQAISKYLDYLRNGKKNSHEEKSSTLTIFPFQKYELDDWNCKWSTCEDICPEQKRRLDTISESDLEQAIFSGGMKVPRLEIQKATNDNRQRPIFVFVLIDNDDNAAHIIEEEDHLILFVKEHNPIKVQKARGAKSLKKMGCCEVISVKDLMYAALSLSLEKARLVDIQSPPIIINTEEAARSLLWTQRPPEVILHLDISLNNVGISYMSSNTEINTVGFESESLVEEFGLYSLDHFLKKEKYGTKTTTKLVIKDWVESLIESEFSEALDYFSVYDLFLKSTDDDLKKDKHFSKKLDPFSSYRPNNYFSNISTPTRTKIKEIFDIEGNEAKVEKGKSLYAERYKRVFFMLYLHCLLEIIYSKLDEKLDHSFDKRNIGYVLIVERALLQDLFSSHEHIKEIAYGCGILKNVNDERNLRILTQGEGVFSRLQEECSIKLPLKNFFVQAQIYNNYLYTTLNQVVKQRESNWEKAEEDVAAIVIKSTVIPLDDIYDTMAKHLYTHIQEEGQKNNICYCTEHSENSSEHGNIFNLSNTKKFISIFKKFFVINFAEDTNQRLDADKPIKLEFNEECDCHMYITYRNILDTAIIRILNNAISLAISTATSNAFFGHYKASHIFFITCYLDDYITTPLKGILNHSLQMWMDRELDEKQIFVGGSVIQKTIHQLMTLSTEDPYPMMSAFFTGCLKQVSSKGYYVQFVSGNDWQISFTNSGRIVDDNYWPLITRKGEQLTEGVIERSFSLKPGIGTKDSKETEIWISIFEVTDDAEVSKFPDGNSLIKVTDGFHGRNQVLESITFIHRVISEQKDTGIDMSFRVDFQNNRSSIEISSPEDDLNKTLRVMHLGERLTLAYT